MVETYFQCTLAGGCGEDNLLKFKLILRMGEELGIN